jgi:hypothetical protein
VIEDLFNTVIRENTARAVHEQHPFTHEQIRNKWKRILENHNIAASETEPRAATGTSHSSTQQAAAASGGARGRGGTAVRGRGGGSRGRGGGPSFSGSLGGGGNSRITPRSTFQGPQAGLWVFKHKFCWKEQMRDFVK